MFPFLYIPSFLLLSPSLGALGFAAVVVVDYLDVVADSDDEQFCQ